MRLDGHAASSTQRTRRRAVIWSASRAPAESLANSVQLTFCHNDGRGGGCGLAAADFVAAGSGRRVRLRPADTAVLSAAAGWGAGAGASTGGSSTGGAATTSGLG